MLDLHALQKKFKMIIAEIRFGNKFKTYSINTSLINIPTAFYSPYGMRDLFAGKFVTNPRTSS